MSNIDRRPIRSRLGLSIRTGLELVLTGGKTALRPVALLGAALLLTLSLAAPVAAQVGDASLSGTVKDSQGGVLPGVTITIESPELIKPRTAVTDGTGRYRLANLPPGQYTLTAELSSFSTYKQEGVRTRAGANFAVNIELKVGGAEETITVTAESPMLEVTSPSNVLNIDGEFVRDVPLSDGAFWSDVLDLTPGVLTRPHNDGSGRQNYFGNAVDHRDAVLLMDGFVASNYNDSNINRTALSPAAIEDTQVKVGGVDAASPMGYGLVLNAVGKTGGNNFSGSALWTYQGIDWASDNTGGQGTPSTRQINQGDFSFGGPIIRNRVWFFTAARLTKNETNSARTPERTQTLKELFHVNTLGGNKFEGFQPYAKVTAQLSDAHTLSAVYQADRLDLNTTAQNAAEPLEVLSTGGDLFGARLVSVWGDSLTTNLAISYNNKGGNNKSSYDGLLREGPIINIHQDAESGGGILEGSGVVAIGGGNTSADCAAACLQYDTASVLMLKGDLSYFVDNFGGSHQFETGFMAQFNEYNRTQLYPNQGFVLQEDAFNDPKDPSKGTHPFHRQYVTSDLTSVFADGKDHDIGFYVQDTWKPNSRLTATIGVRADLIKREDVRRGFTYQTSTEVGPRFGFSYLVTEDAKNVLRASFTRQQEQLQGGRHPVASFGGDPGTSYRDEYDVLGNGTFSSVIITPAASDSTSRDQFADNLTQPIIDEAIIGFRRQFPGEISVDVAGIYRRISNMFGSVDINGIYPDAPRQPFIGFGRVDPNAGIIEQVRNNDWSTIRYKALQMTVAKNMSHGFEAMIALHKQWQHLEGTWNPTDRAGFIQPDAFPNDKLLFRTRGPADQNTLPGSTNANMWFPYSVRTAVTWHAPFGVRVAANYSIIKPSWSGPIVDRLSSSDPDIKIFGPSTVVSSTGVRQTNPLSRRERFRYATRGEGQVLLPSVHQLGVRLTKSVSLGRGQSVEVTGAILNMLNGGNGFEFARGGANRSYAGPTIFLQPGNIQPPRSYQLALEYRF